MGLALGRRGRAAQARPVVLQDHRLQPGAAGRAGHPGPLAAQGAPDAGALDRPFRGRARPFSGDRPRGAARGVHHGPDTCSARASWRSPRPSAEHRAGRRGSRRRRVRRRVRARWRPARRRSSRPRRSARYRAALPQSARPGPGAADLRRQLRADGRTAPARSSAVRRTTSAIWSSRATPPAGRPGGAAPGEEPARRDRREAYLGDGP